MNLDEKLQRSAAHEGGRPGCYHREHLMGRLGYRVAETTTSGEPAVVEHRSMDRLYVWEVGAWNADRRDHQCHMVAEYRGAYDEAVKDHVGFDLVREWDRPTFEAPPHTQPVPERRSGRRGRP